VRILRTGTPGHFTHEDKRMRIIPPIAIALAFGGLTAFAAPAEGQNPTPPDTTTRADTSMRTDTTTRTVTGRRRAARRPATAGQSASMQTASGACAAAPAVAAGYLRDQVSAGRKLTMTRGAAISEVTKLTGADGEFAGLKPCDSGYPNAVRFYLDEVIKAGTNNSTP